MIFFYRPQISLNIPVSHINVSRLMETRINTKETLSISIPFICHLHVCSVEVEENNADFVS